MWYERNYCGGWRQSAARMIDAPFSVGSLAVTGLQLHLGIHAGDVIREGDNIFGGAVNIASRIAGEAMLGEILVSESYVRWRVRPQALLLRIVVSML